MINMLNEIEQIQLAFVAAQKSVASQDRKSADPVEANPC
jgi:hypothetical protein